MGWAVPLADVRLSEDDIAAVAETYRTGWLSMGPQTEQLERSFADYAGAGHAIATANGTAALHLMLAAAGLGPGDEVVVPSLTFVATVNAVAYTGARPRFADVAGLTRPWLEASTVEPVLNERTRAILTMHYGGDLAGVTGLRELAERRGLSLFEDAAHAVGARVGSRHAGTFGAAGAFSFFSNKNLAVGEGGMVVTGDDGLAAEMRLRRSHGMTSLSWDRHRGHASEYDVVALGFNYRIDEPRSALARRRLAVLDEENARRGELVAAYRDALGRLPGVTLVDAPAPGTTSAHHLFTILLDPSVDRAAFRSDLAAAGVQTSVHYPPAHRFSIYAAQEADLPRTEEYAARTVTLPLFAHMSAAQQGLVIDAVEAALGTARGPLAQPASV